VTAGSHAWVCRNCLPKEAGFGNIDFDLTGLGFKPVRILVIEH
jgi:hypothetical protein